MNDTDAQRESGRALAAKLQGLAGKLYGSGLFDSDTISNALLGSGLSMTINEVGPGAAAEILRNLADAVERGDFVHQGH